MVKLPEFRTYNRENCITFRKTTEKFGGLSNMAGGYPLLINDVKILTSEAIYQACRFPHLPEVQKLIIAEKSPMTAKMVSKPYRDNSRPDWDIVRTKIMRWCLQVKLIQNWDKFSRLLLETEELPIVEDSWKDDFWGAKLKEGNTLIGANVLGRLLMQLREQIKSEKITPKTTVMPLSITDFLLYGQEINPIISNYENSSNNLLQSDKPKNEIVIQPIQVNAAISNLKLNQQNNLNKVNSDYIKPATQQHENNLNELNAFNIMLPHIESVLINERTDKELAEMFEVPIKLMRDWLNRAVILGKVKKLSKAKPIKYVVEHQLALFNDTAVY